ncbi:glycosyltransferase [Aerococcus urinaeequi]|uniref:glycosyltransferase n=1 Tax=Aerococcus urinaeequi TaxID=51665 RepID=UPI003EDA0051
MQTNLDVLFIGGLFPQDLESQIQKNSINLIQNAANNLQWEIVKGFDINLNTPVKVLTAPFIGSFPKSYIKLRIRKHYFKHSPNQKHLDVSSNFVNLKIISHYSKFYNMKKEINQWLEDGKPNKLVIGYSMTYPVTRALNYIKKKNKDVKTTLIVTDLPQFMNENSFANNRIFRTLKTFEIKSMTNHLKNISGYIFMTEQMSDYFPNKPFIVMEGISTDLFKDIEISNTIQSQKVILYTGTLMEKYGIKSLVESFIKGKFENVKLQICGAGDYETEIMRIANKNPNIEFLGQLPRKDILHLQKKATFLINPRTNSGTYTRYSFPSKTIEYLSSGTPMMGYRLDGIPEEYYNYIIEIPTGENGIINTIESVLKLTNKEIEMLGYSGKTFVMGKKNNKIQGKRILDFVTNLEVGSK